MSGFDGGSFRDPAGRVFISEGRVFRSIMPIAHEAFRTVSSNSFVRELIDAGRLIGFDELSPETASSVYRDRGPAPASILEHPRIEVISYPYEWPFLMLKAAALHHLDLQLDLLKNNLTLIDATAYNVQFRGPNPIFIDLLSLRPYVPGTLWAGHQQFCDQFLNPLLLRSLVGISHNAWYRGSPEGIPTAALARLLKLKHKFGWKVWANVILPARLQQYAEARTDALTLEKVSRRPLPRDAFALMLTSLRRWIARLEPRSKGRSTWGDYADDNSYSGDEAETKRRVIGEFVATVRPSLLLDLGCNTGNYSEAALENGAGYVVGFDTDPIAIEKAFARASRLNLRFLPLVVDLANPSPAQGWKGVERTAIGDRVSADALIALAVIHHLAIGRNVPLDEVVKTLTGLAPRGLIEFVPKSDPTVQRMLALREDIFATYSEANFSSLLEREATIVARRKTSETGRIIYEYTRK